ncbi:MAG TPA: CaiB/BaiF CoA-transferase family protein [Candidatus Sulfotelmatobacter sp.]|nr:CaiB/BaiF CoA-transferase family protein [Candidatus Sulfotelmatobacter sp.]
MGPLAGIKVVELAGIGPGPFCSMMLSDMGAEVLRVDRTEAADLGVPTDAKYNLLNRGRRSVAVDLKKPEGIAAVKKLIAKADAVIEGFRPGVMERLGLSPEECLKLNPRLVYGRMTGWGQAGPIAHAAGHDINYIALTGALYSIGNHGGPPVPPLNLVGDFGGGAMYLAFGIVCALLECRSSGRGQIVDTAMIDGAASLMTGIYGLRAAGRWTDSRGSNILDTGAPWYGVYETKDGKHVSIGAIEAKFYAELLRLTGLDKESLPKQHDRAGWPKLRERLTAVFKGKTREEWCKVMEGSDVCFAPVLSMAEAPNHPHMKARGTFVEVDGVMQPGPAPRFSRTRAEIQRGPARAGQHTQEALADWGFSAGDIEGLRKAAAIG